MHNQKHQISSFIAQLSGDEFPKKKVKTQKKNGKAGIKALSGLKNRNVLTGTKTVEMEVFCEMAVDSDLFSAGTFGYPVS